MFLTFYPSFILCNPYYYFRFCSSCSDSLSQLCVLCSLLKFSWLVSSNLQRCPRCNFPSHPLENKKAKKPLLQISWRVDRSSGVHHQNGAQTSAALNFAHTPSVTFLHLDPPSRLLTHPTVAPPMQRRLWDATRGYFFPGPGLSLLYLLGSIFPVIYGCKTPNNPSLSLALSTLNETIP